MEYNMLSNEIFMEYVWNIQVLQGLQGTVNATRLRHVSVKWTSRQGLKSAPQAGRWVKSAPGGRDLMALAAHGPAARRSTSKRHPGVFLFPCFVS
jgi:hypothetical protein